jgi:dTDP-4-dehydrorhamnose reductase
MRVTLFGASGLLGQELVRELSADPINDLLTALSSPDADLRDPTRVRERIRDSRPDWVILSAAYTDVDGCESNRDQAFAVNCEGAVNVAQAARAAGARLLFLSTDYVFDGTNARPTKSPTPEIQPASMAKAKPAPRNACKKFCPKSASPALPGSSATEANAFPPRF